MMITQVTNSIHKPLVKIRQRLESYTSQRLYFIEKPQNWVINWVTYYLMMYLRDNHDLVSRTALSGWHLRNQIIHFGDRYDLLSRDSSKLHASNHTFLTWYHGKPDTPEMVNLFENLLTVEPKLTGIVTSCQQSSYELVKFGIDSQKIDVIPIGIDLQQFKPPTAVERQHARTQLGISVDAICIGSFQKDGVGWGDGNDPKLIKGPDIFLETIAELHKTYSNLFVLLTGPARGYVKHGLDKIGVPFVHHYLDSYHDIVPYYWALDIYLITSRVEGGPKAFLESWATGTPVVSTRMGMPADFVVHEHNGMIAEIDNVNDLVNHISAFIKDINLRKSCSQTALQDVEQFGWQIVAKQHYDQLYQRFLND